jgi:hypothetical protein
MLQVIATDTIWLLNTATSGGAAYMYEFSRLSMRNNTLQHNSGEVPSRLAAVLCSNERLVAVEPAVTGKKSTYKAMG